MSRFRFRPNHVPAPIIPITFGLVAFAATAFTAPALYAAESQAKLPVRAVALFSSGVGYTEHGGPLTGDTTVRLNFKSSQINDVLKSLVIDDKNADGGRADPGAVGFPTQEPLRRTLSGFQINLAKNPSMANILTQIRGAAITARHQGETIAGRLLGIEQRPMALGKDGNVITDWALTLSTDGTLRTMALRDVTDIRLADPDLRAELARALAALDAGRNRDAKPVTVRFTGTGARNVRLGYITEAPVWKTTYRVVLSDDGTDPYLQGWAIVENQSQNDWQNITLSLIAGRPISFVQDLYSPLYAQRPKVPVQTQIPVAPRRHTRGQAGTELSAKTRPGKSVRRSLRRADDRAEEKASSPVARVAEALMKRQAAQPPLDPTRTAAAATGDEVGELFQYTINHVTLARQSSAMLPIVSQSITGEKISLFNESTHRTRAMNGVMLVNSTGLQLAAGAVTVFDGGLYAGDALLGDLPKNQDRLITFAVDLDIDVQTRPGQGARAITSGRIVKGVLQMTYKSRRTRGFVAQNKSDASKTLIIETTRAAGWDLVDTAKPWQSTNQAYRFKLKLPANGKTELSVTQEIVRGETLALLNADQTRLLRFARNGAFTPDVRDALARVAKLRQTVTDIERQIDHRERAVTTYRTEQKRVRDNLRSVGKNTKFHDRMMAKLDLLETALETAYGDIETLRAQLLGARDTYETHLGKLNIG